MARDAPDTPFPLEKEGSALAKPELGAKQICPNCQAKFYDLGRRPARCPKCETEFDPEEVVRTRRGRSREIVAELPEDDSEDQVKGKIDADDEDEDDSVTPEIDQEAEAIVIDDEDAEDDVAVKGGVGMGEASDDDDDVDLADDDDDSVPFIEDDDDDSFDDEIDVGADDEDDR